VAGVGAGIHVLIAAVVAVRVIERRIGSGVAVRWRARHGLTAGRSGAGRVRHLSLRAPPASATPATASPPASHRPAAVGGRLSPAGTLNAWRCRDDWRLGRRFGPSFRSRVRRRLRRLLWLRRWGLMLLHWLRPMRLCVGLRPAAVARVSRGRRSLLAARPRAGLVLNDAFERPRTALVEIHPAVQR